MRAAGTRPRRICARVPRLARGWSLAARSRWRCSALAWRSFRRPGRSQRLCRSSSIAQPARRWSSPASTRTRCRKSPRSISTTRPSSSVPTRATSSTCSSATTTRSPAWRRRRSSHRTAPKFTGDAAMQTKLGTTWEHRVSVVSVRMSTTTSPGRNGEAIVTFDKEIKEYQGMTPTTTRYVATVRFEYRPKSMKKDVDRIENPFGFVVLSYRADPELITPAPAVADGPRDRVMHGPSHLHSPRAARSRTIAGRARSPRRRSRHRAQSHRGSLSPATPASATSGTRPTTSSASPCGAGWSRTSFSPRTRPS